METFTTIKIKQNALKRILTVGKYWMTNPHPELGTYILPIKILYNVHSLLFFSPVNLVYDPIVGHYVLKHCHPIQQLICFLALCFGSLNIIQNVRYVGHVLLADTGYIVSYFDFFYIFILDCFIYIHMYLHWFQLDSLNAWLRPLQRSSLVQFCALPVWKAKIIGWLILLSSIYCSIIFTLTMLGLNLTFTVQQIYDNVEPFVAPLFWMKPSQEGGSGVVMRSLTLISRFYDANYMHVSLNAFIPIYYICCYYLSKDFFEALVRKRVHKILPEQALEYYDEYMGIIQGMNAFYGPYCFHFPATAMTFQSVHLLDALNTPSLTWKVNMYIYILSLIFYLEFSTKILMAGRKVKKWLSMNKNYEKIGAQELRSILYDLNMNRLGLRGYKLFTVSPSFAGITIQSMLTYALLNLQHKK